MLRILPPGGTRLVAVLLNRISPYVTTGEVPIRFPNIVCRAAQLIHRAKAELTSFSFRAPRFAQRSLSLAARHENHSTPAAM